jgi:hypothetical protein
MFGHDPLCPIDDLNPVGCPVCAALTAARGEERARYSETWKANIALVEARNYREGYADCGAGRPPRVDLIGPRT